MFHYDLKETTRPTMYRALKYWGKKPHNIWRNLISSNTNEKDIVFDPFAGSALTFFESLKINRKPIIADINPLSLFLVNIYSKNYDIEKIKNRFYEIKNIIEQSNIYKKNFISKCSNCGTKVEIYNFRWNKNIPISYSYKCNKCNKTITDINNLTFYEEDLNFWQPSLKIDKFSSVCESSLKFFGSNDISGIYTKRNLEILSFIFHLINKSNSNIKDPLMFSFLQILHLTTKMCALRSEKTNRPLSTSWGRPAYMALSKFMEQNPLIQFHRSLFGSNGLFKALKSRNDYIPKYSFSEKIEDIKDVDGIVLMEDSRKIQNLKANLIITDPPYGSIIQYGELSSIWNVWLEKFNKRYKNNLKNEIIVNKNNSYEKYIKDMTLVLSNCYKILQKKGKMIMTFNSNDTMDWNSIYTAIKNSKLSIEDKYVQKNKRSSEANVYASTELANTDYYLFLKRKVS